MSDIECGDSVLAVSQVTAVYAVGFEIEWPARRRRFVGLTEAVPLKTLLPFLRHRKGCARTLNHVGGPFIGESTCDCGYAEIAAVLGISVDTGYDGAEDGFSGLGRQ